VGHVRDDDVVGQAGLAGGRDIDGGNSFGNEFLVVGRVEILDEDGVGFWHEEQVQSGLDLENQLFLRDDVEGQSSRAAG
jgi:hypothetical protein